MYNPFDLSSFSTPIPDLTSLLESVIDDSNIDDFITTDKSIFTEAVFNNGRKTIQPIIDGFQSVKDALEKEISETGSNFNPRKFYSHTSMKDLEFTIMNTFGLRDVSVEHFIEKYNKSSDDFESKELNCYTWIPSRTRFPIDALITENGFFDKSHQLRTRVLFTLGIIRACTAEELTAILVHEIGHNIDPAIVSITYIETNVLSKYITDRKGSIDPKEREYIDNKNGGKSNFVILVIIGIFFGITFIINFIKKLLFNPNKAIGKIKELITADNNKFSRQENSEAFADNFARMYGLGSQLMSGINKISTDMSERLSRIEKEKVRQQAIANITMAMIQDVHKTDIHRIRNLIKEYNADLVDPNIPTKVKADMRKDLEELEKVLDLYLNHKDEFQKRINQLINDELQQLDEDVKPKDNKTKKVTPTTESLIMENPINDHLIDLRLSEYGEIMLITESMFNEKLSTNLREFGRSIVALIKKLITFIGSKIKPLLQKLGLMKISDEDDSNAQIAALAKVGINIDVKGAKTVEAIKYDNFLNMAKTESTILTEKPIIIHNPIVFKRLKNGQHSIRKWLQKNIPIYDAAKIKPMLNDLINKLDNNIRLDVIDFKFGTIPYDKLGDNITIEQYTDDINEILELLIKLYNRLDPYLSTLSNRLVLNKIMEHSNIMSSVLVILHMGIYHFLEPLNKDTIAQFKDLSHICEFVKHYMNETRGDYSALRRALIKIFKFKKYKYGYGGSRIFITDPDDDKLGVKIAHNRKGILDNKKEKDIWDRISSTNIAQYFVPVNSIDANGYIIRIAKASNIGKVNMSKIKAILANIDNEKLQISDYFIKNLDLSSDIDGVIPNPGNIGFINGKPVIIDYANAFV